MANPGIVTRFAPSPTGYLHVGGARTALFSWLLARHAGGRYLLRIEDTDLARSTQESVDSLLEDLRWLGLNHDNAELVFQSKRLQLYNDVIANLISRGMAYEAFETEQELDQQRKLAEREKRPYIYRRPQLTDEQVRRYKSEDRPAVVRFAMPVAEYRFHDVVLDKEVVLHPSQVQDFIIRKTDGMPTYHFAVVIDDQAMGITHVLRGQEHLLNTMNHIALMQALDYPRPVFGHLPVILNPEDGSKMGKRDRDKKVRHHANLWLKNTKLAPLSLASEAGLDPDRIAQWLDDSQSQLDGTEQRKVMRVVGLQEADLPEILVHDFRKNGYLPEVLLNFISLLGWSPGGDRERMSLEEMTRLFSLEGIGKANAKFNREKLLAFNTEAVAAATPQRLLSGFKDYLSMNPESPLNAADDAALARVLQMKKGFRLFREVDDLARFFFLPDEQIAFDPEAVEKVLRKNNAQGAGALREVRAVLYDLTEWTASSIEATVTRYGESKGVGLGKIAQPIRVAISGRTVSPPIFESLEFLGRDRTLRRIDRCLDTIG